MTWLYDNWASVVFGLVALSAWLRVRQQERLVAALAEHNVAMQRALLALSFMHRSAETHSAFLASEGSAASGSAVDMVPTAQKDLDAFVRKALGPTY